MKLPSLIKGWLTTKNIVDSQPEELLADYVATNNKQALNLFVAHFHADLFHYILSLSDQTLAEDIIQQTWVKVMNSARYYQPNTSLKSWLFSIARNTLIDELRRNHRWKFEELSDTDIENTFIVNTTSPEYLLIQQNQQALFNHVIEHLPFYQREAFIFQQEGFSLNEICDLTNENFETVKSRIRYAKKCIKKQLEAKREELADENG